MAELTPTTHFMCSAVDRTAEYLPLIAAELDKAADILVHSLLNDKKILVAGAGFAAPLAQILTTAFMDQHEIERPGLPAINLASDSITMSSIAASNESGDIFGKQVRAIGMEGDCLVVIAMNNLNADILRAIEIANDKHLSTVLINASQNKNHLPNGILISEVDLRAENLSHGIEICALSINTLIKCVESKLFGIPLT